MTSADRAGAEPAGGWQLYRGDGVPQAVDFPPPPPWRFFASAASEEEDDMDVGSEPDHHFQVEQELVNAVNAALYLRRPLLLTGPPGSGKSSLIKAVAHELRLGRVLRWHVTSSSMLRDALYRYDAIGRLQEQQLYKVVPPVSSYLRLGPLGTALVPRRRPRALLIDEIDKSDVDLPNDLLDVFESGSFEIPELTRLRDQHVDVPIHDGLEAVQVTAGKIQCREFPFVVLTSNGERELPAPFLRRCVSFRMAQPSVELLTRIVTAHLGARVGADGDDRSRSMVQDLVQAFADDTGSGRSKATDQLLNAIFLLTGPVRPSPEQAIQLRELLLKELETEPL